MWYTTKDGKHINTDWFDKDRQVEINAQEARKLNAKDQSSNIHEFGYWDYEDDGWQGEEVQRQLAWFKKNSNLEEWEKSLTDAEKNALSLYTSYGYNEINTGIRTGKASDAARHQTDLIRQAIDKFELKQPMVVARTSSGEMLGLRYDAGFKELQSMIGKTVNPGGFISTNTSQAGSIITRANVTYKIEVPAGKGVGAWLPTTAGQLNKNESEFLIQSFRSRRFKVKSVSKNKYGHNVVTLRMVKEKKGS